MSSQVTPDPQVAAVGISKMMLTRPSVNCLVPSLHVRFRVSANVPHPVFGWKIGLLSCSTMPAADEQQSLWLSAALVQADLSPYIADAAAWMRSEQAAIADLFCDAIISDLGATLKLTKTQLRRLRSAIESLGPDTVPLPGNQVPQLYAPCQ